MFSAWGVNNKKVPNLYEMGLLACFVTPEIEKSNFYKDLDKLITIEFKKHEDKNKST